MKKFFLLLMFSVFFLCSNQVLASHYMGSEITYTCLGGNQYEVTLSFYYDCNSVPAPSSATVSLSSSCSNSTAMLSAVAGSPFDITPVCATTTSPCNGGPGNGINKSVYKGTVTLAACSNWEISYTSCCRNSLPTNLQNPNSQSHFVSAKLNNSAAACNNSPAFQSEATLYSCMGDTTYHSFNAYDSDGDSLVYSLAPCQTSATSNAPYAAGYAATVPFTGSTTIDAQTGLLTVFATTAQTSAICVRVEEYRNGAKIGQVTRDIQVTMLACTNALPKVHKINNGNIAFNSNLTGNVGMPINMSLYIYDAEAFAGTQTLSTAAINNFPTATTSFNAATSTFTFSWTPTAADVGKHFLNIEFNDNNCPYIGENQYTITINVLASPFVIAVNDAFSGTENMPISGSVLTNDLSNGTLTVNLTTISMPMNGTFTIDPSGNFTYMPNMGFVGLDSISYEVCDGTPICDFATALLDVQPAPLPVYNLTDTIVLGENYPMYYCFSDAASYLSDTLDNAVMTFINDSCFTLYGDNLGTDVVTLSSSYEVVNFQITVVNGVWPGDTDDDALVNNTDLLNIGLAYGMVGIPRNSQSILWNGYLADDWSNTFPSGLNAKHADTDGNGTINADDTLAIIQNWGLSYNKNGGGNGAPIYLEIDSMTIVNNTIAYIPIMLADAQTPISNLYGLAFTVNYNSGLVQENSIMVDFQSSWLGTTSNMISITKDFYDNELMEIAVTRIDGTNMGGSGQIGRIYFNIQENIMPDVDSIFTFEISNVTAIDNNNTTVDIQGLSRDIHLETLLGIVNNTTAIDLSKNINIYPNPATDYLNIATKGVQIETVEIYDMTGRQVLTNQNLMNNQLNISTLSEGMYIVHVKTNLGVWNEKITVLK